MRIAFIGQKGIELGEKGGGIEQHVAALSRHFVLRGNDVTVYARNRYRPTDVTEIQKKHGRPKVEGRRSKGGGLVVKYIPTIYTKNLEAIVHTFLCTIHALFQPYDVIHYHGVGPSTLSWIPRLLRPGVKVVATFHSKDRLHRKWGWFARKYLKFGEWAICRFPQATITVSHVLQVYARRKFHCPAIYIPNGTEMETVRTRGALRTFKLTADKYLLNVSRLVPHKGQHYLIAAFQRMKLELGANARGWKLVLVGAPTYTAEYEKHLRELAVGDPSIVFAGYQTGTPLKELFANCYVYVQPSESEGLPISVMEAMSFGKSVLVSDIPENLEVIDHVGFSFVNRSIRDLALQIISLMKKPATVKRSADKCKKYVKKEYSWDRIAQKTQEVYDSLI